MTGAHSVISHARPILIAMMLSLILAVLLLLPSVSLAATDIKAASPIRTAGKVMLLGGAMQDDNAAVYNALRLAAGSPGMKPRIAVLCSASPSYSDAFHEWSVDDPGSISYQNLFLSYGFEPVFIPVAVDNYLVESYRQANVDLIKSCTAVFFNGGWQERHTRCMFEDDGRETPVMAAVRSVYEAGGVIAGTSAGCAVQGATTYGDGTSYGYLKANHLIPKLISDVNTADPNNPDNGGYVKGLGFTAPYDALCDSHFEAQGRFGRPLVAMRDIGAKLAFGVDENTGFLLDGDIGRVYGQHGVTILDASSATYGKESYFTVSKVTVSYLTQGDTYTFSTREVTSTKPLATVSAKAYNSSKIFSPYEASKVMGTLFRSSNASATGSSAEKKPRFILTFTKTGSTSKGYYNPSTGLITVDKLNLEVTYSMK